MLWIIQPLHLHVFQIIVELLCISLVMLSDGVPVHLWISPPLLQIFDSLLSCVQKVLVLLPHLLRTIWLLLTLFCAGTNVVCRLSLLKWIFDSRHGIKDVDREMMKMLDEAAVGYRVVLTKADKMKASELAKVIEATEAEARKHVAAFPEIHVTSAEKGMGIGELRAAVLGDAGV